jgi:hypothetical protein
MKCILLRGRWCDIIVLYAHAPTEENSADSKAIFCEELEHAFHHFPKHDMKILLRDFNAKLGREYIFKPTIANENLCDDSDDNGVKSRKLCHIKKSSCYETLRVCTINEYAAYTECRSLGVSRSKLNRKLCHHYRCLDTAHCAILIFNLYYNFNRVLTLITS